MRAAIEEEGQMPANKEKEIVRLFEREVEMTQNTNVTAKFGGVAIVILSALCIIVVWVSAESEQLNQPPEATPGERPPVSPSPSSGSPQL